MRDRRWLIPVLILAVLGTAAVSVCVGSYPISLEQVVQILTGQMGQTHLPAGVLDPACAQNRDGSGGRRSAGACRRYLPMRVPQSTGLPGSDGSRFRRISGCRLRHCLGGIGKSDHGGILCFGTYVPWYGADFGAAVRR